MNKSTRYFLFLLIFAAASGLQAQSTQVYTWTDENGVVHFSDSRPDNPDAISIPAPEAPRPGSTGAYPQADAEITADDEDPALVENFADEKRRQLAEARQQAQEQQAERERLCSQATAQLDAIEPSRRVYYTNDQGETVRLDDEERVRLVAEAQLVIDQNCN